MKYEVWFKESRGSEWDNTGELLTLKQAERIAKEIRHDCGVYATRILPNGHGRHILLRPKDDPAGLTEHASDNTPIAESPLGKGHEPDDLWVEGERGSFKP